MASCDRWVSEQQKDSLSSSWRILETDTECKINPPRENSVHVCLISILNSDGSSSETLQRAAGQLRKNTFFVRKPSPARQNTGKKVALAQTTAQIKIMSEKLVRKSNSSIQTSKSKYHTHQVRGNRSTQSRIQISSSEMVHSTKFQKSLTNPLSQI